MFKALLITLVISLTHQNCKDSSPFCLSCHKDQCVECIYSYLSNKTCVVPTVTIKNCMFYSTNNKCSFCEPQFTLKDNQCVPINVVNCKHSEKQGECLICQDNLKLSHDNQCTDTCNLENCKNCAKDIFSNEFCATCENGFSVNSFLRCQTEPISHCDKVLDNKCMRCKIGNRHDGEKCHKVDYIKILEEKTKQNQEKKDQKEMVLLKASNPNTDTQNQKKPEVKNDQKYQHKPINSSQQTHQQNKQVHTTNNDSHHQHKPTSSANHNNHHSSSKSTITHHHNDNQENQNKPKNSIIVKADKLLNESKVNLETNKKTNTGVTSGLKIPMLFFTILISYLVNQ